ncbi:MAG: peptide deformylase [Patescibacteria group bacterium]|nr:peptide deformylase [Patescibacteria group bacterium]MCL5093612.1 peptide deformylase [Patescibacteria group bacterium]
MKELKVIKVPNNILREKSRKIPKVDESTIQLAQKLAELVESHKTNAESGVAIAAIQVGIPLKLIIIKEENGDFLPLANPEITKKYKNIKEDLEGCMSIPGVYGLVERSEKVKVKALDMNNKIVQFKAEGFLSRVIQHEIDHTNGILFIDHITDAGRLYYPAEDGTLVSKKGEVLDETIAEI